MDITIQCTHSVSPQPSQANTSWTHRKFARAPFGWQGLHDAPLRDAVEACRGDAEATLETKFKDTSMQDKFFDLMLLDFGGRRLG